MQCCVCVYLFLLVCMSRMLCTKTLLERVSILEGRVSVWIYVIVLCVCVCLGEKEQRFSRRGTIEGWSHSSAAQHLAIPLWYMRQERGNYTAQRMWTWWTGPSLANTKWEQFFLPWGRGALFTEGWRLGIIKSKRQSINTQRNLNNNNIFL